MLALRTRIVTLLLGMAVLAAPRGLAEGTGQASETVQRSRPPRALIFLWMSGGVSHLDTFDMKPDAPLEIRGSFKPIPTSVPGLQISEHLPRFARLMHQVTLIRSLTHREANHSDAEFLMHTGRPPRGFANYPSLPAALAKELSDEQSLLPFHVCIGGYPGVGAGYLEGQYAPLLVNDELIRRPAKAPVPPPVRIAPRTEQQLAELVRQLSDAELSTRQRARAQLEDLGILALPTLRTAQAAKPDLATHQRIDGLIDRIKNEQFAQALNLDREPLALRESYGRDRFGQGCLAARRLVERGVPVVEVILGGWDTHVDNFRAVKRGSGVLDAGWAALLSDLKERGLLDTTLVVWIGEFGRSPRINAHGGRDHWPQAFSVVLAGGGIKAGAVVGKTDRTGAQVAERPVTVPELMATICAALGVDPSRRQQADRGITIPLVDDNALPIKEALREKATK